MNDPAADTTPPSVPKHIVTLSYRIYGSVDVNLPQNATRENIEEAFSELPDAALIDGLSCDGDDIELTVATKPNGSTIEFII